MKSKFFEILQKAKDVVFRYPLVLLMSMLMAACMIYLVGTDYSIEEEFHFLIVKLIILSSLGISLMFALKILSQRIGKGFLWEILGLIFLFGFYFILPANEDDFTEVYAFLLIPVYILSHLLVAFVAFIRKKDSEKNFWQFNKNLFVNFFLTLVFTGVLCGGVELAILAVDQLFNMDFDYKVYAIAYYFLAIFGSTFIFLLFNETGLLFLEKEGDYPVVLKFFTQFVLIPLLFIYVIILYFYSAKILINWELPRGWVSYLVLAYSVVGILALLLVHPLKENTAKSWVKIFSKVFYFTLIPLAFLLFTAIFTRVLEYGYTEPRYFVLLLAVWISAVILYFIFSRKPGIKFIPISLFLFGLFALVFPYFNAFSVAKRSQKNQVEKVLAENNLLTEGKFDFNQKVTDSVLYEIEDKFEFLDDRCQRDYIEQFFDEETKKKLPEKGYWNLNPYFKNIRKTSRFQSGSTYVQIQSADSLYKIEDYQYMVYQQDLINSIEINGDTFQLKHVMNKNFELTLNKEVSVDFMPMIEKLCSTHAGGNQNVENLFLEKDLGKYHIKVIFKSIQKSSYDPENEDYWMSDALFLIKERE